ncbi:MAG: selenium cofactor biosynthesis protein YqeC [Candidatus Flexifilum sp.]
MLTDSLADAFELVPGDIVSIVGAGGKTSLLVGLARELTARGWKVLVTTTTRLAADQLDLFPARVEGADDRDALAAALDAHGCVIVYSEIRGGKALGIPPDRVPALQASLDLDIVLVEADGARGLPLKFFRRDEPVLASGTTRIILCMDHAGVGESYATGMYNAEAWLSLSPLNTLTLDDPVSEAEFIRLLYFSAVRLVEQHRDAPHPAPISLFVNHAPQDFLQPPDPSDRAARIDWGVHDPFKVNRVDRIVGGHVQYRTETWRIGWVWRQVMPVVLAAGLSRRMGTTKVLLPWEDGKTILDRVLTVAVRSLFPGGCGYVVTGHNASPVIDIAASYAFRTVHNPDYEAGDMLSSLKTGLRALPRGVCAALIMLGDQPLIDEQTVRDIVDAYQTGKGWIIAPSYQMRRGHPILIDRTYWDEILALPPDGAPRDVINRHADAIHYVLVADDSILFDVDTPEQYREARRRAGLDP